MRDMLICGGRYTFLSAFSCAFEFDFTFAFGSLDFFLTMPWASNEGCCWT